MVASSRLILDYGKKNDLVKTNVENIFFTMLRAVSFLKQFGEGILGILTLKLCCGHSRSCSGLLEAFLL